LKYSPTNKDLYNHYTDLKL